MAMQNENKVLISGRFIPSGIQPLEDRVAELEKYLMLLTQELELRMSEI